MNTHKRILIFMMCVKMIFCFSQEKSCTIQLKNVDTKKNGYVGLEIKNISNSIIRVPKIFNPYYAQIIDIHVLDIESNSFTKLGYESSDPNCYKNCLGKLKKLKKNATSMYEIDIRENFPYKNKGIYKFKILFNTNLISRCPEFISDWYTYELQ